MADIGKGKQKIYLFLSKRPTKRMVYSGSNLMENSQSYGAAKVKGMGFFKKGAISGRFMTFFWARWQNVEKQEEASQATCTAEHSPHCWLHQTS